jgi:integrase
LAPSPRPLPRGGEGDPRELNRLEKLSWWNAKKVCDIDAAALAAYAVARRKKIRGGDGGRAIDLELNTLRNVIRHALATRAIERDPLAGLDVPRFSKPSSEINHCRDKAPASADELHLLAADLFESPRSDSLGWQLLIAAMTGCRTSELLKLRHDARGRQPGSVEPISGRATHFAPEGTQQILWIERSKGGCNPWAYVHPSLADCLAALANWRAARFPETPWYFPSFVTAGATHVDPGSLTHALAVLGPRIAKAERTSHGLRSFYVTVRRSQGVPDPIIALEIGHRSGGALMCRVYGDAAPVQLDWHPTKIKPAWSSWLPEGESKIVQFR